MLTICILIAIIAYLIGSINFSVILSKKMAGFDVRQKGSGNAGTTNMLRSVGKKAAAITLICDILKGVVSIGIAILVGYLFNAQNKSILVQIAAIAVVIGHTFPIFFGNVILGKNLHLCSLLIKSLSSSINDQIFMLFPSLAR